MLSNTSEKRVLEVVPGTSDVSSASSSKLDDASGQLLQGNVEFFTVIVAVAIELVARVNLDSPPNLGRRAAVLNRLEPAHDLFRVGLPDAEGFQEFGHRARSWEE